MTMQLFQRNADLITPWISHLKRSTGRRLLLFVDECHFLAEGRGSRTDNAWYEAIRLAEEAGAHVVELTATPYRSDSRVLPGFQTETERERSVAFSQFRPHSDPELAYRDDYTGTSRRIRIKADHETTFKEAWDERPTPLCKLSRWPFDVDLTQFTWEGEEAPPLAEKHLLSRLSTQETRQVLGRVVRDPHTIERGVNMALDSLRQQRQLVGTLEPRLLIFVANDGHDDEDDGRDVHAHQVKRIVERAVRARGELLRVEVATGNTEDAADVIRRFADPAQPGDVLILKQMAGLGLTAKPVKTLLDLSTVRQAAACLQRWMRAATPFHHFPAILITPDDVLSGRIFDELVKGEGGGQTITDVELVRTLEIERNESVLTEWSVDGVTHATFKDSDGRIRPAEEQPIVTLFRYAFPEVGELFTHAALAERMREYNITVTGTIPSQGPVDTGVVIEERQERLNLLVKSIVRLQHPGERYVKERSGEYGRRVAAVWVRLKERGAVPLNVEIKQVTDLGALDRMIDAAKRWIDRLTTAQPVS
jgi:hypothetical protein